jgi:hypothetical protein
MITIKNIVLVKKNGVLRMASRKKSFIKFKYGILITCFILPSGLAMAQSDGALDITGQLGVETDVSVPSLPEMETEIKSDEPQFSIETLNEDVAASETPITQDTDEIIFPSLPDLNTQPAPSSVTSRDVPSVSLSNKDPKGVMLATVGINTEARGVLSRTMWQSSQVSDVIPLMERLPDRVSSPLLDQLLRHIMMSRAIPPNGATQNADNYVSLKLEWMRDKGLSEMLAEFVRQLPEDEKWISWSMFLLDHNLITKNDAELCQKVDSLRDVLTLTPTDNDALLKIQIFCALLSGEDSLASFQLDLLEERGIQDELFFNVLRARIDGTIPDIAGPVLPTGLNIALMDLDNIMISPDIRQNMPVALSQSLNQLSYLNPETAYYQFGVTQYLRLKPLEDQMMEWPFIPQNSINLSMAITQFADKTDTDRDRLTEASQRIMLWHSLLSTDNPSEKLDITLIALDYDLGRIGVEALDIWAPHLAAAITEMTPENEQALLKYNQAVMMLVIANYPLPQDVVTGLEHVAWQNLENEVMAGQMMQDMLRNMNAYDAIPLLESVGIEVEPLTEADRFVYRPRLASAKITLAYPDILLLEQHPARARPAETILMLAAVLQDTPLHSLSRDDAAILGKALYDAGLIEESRQFAIDIIRAWGAYRANHKAKDTDGEES